MHLIERHARVYRHTWLVLVSGIFEPLFYLLSIGVGIGHLVGTVTGPGGQQVGYTSFVAPALLATSAMNGAIYDSTFNVFFRLKYAKFYDAALATPMRPGDLALGEIGWALIRGGLYGLAFMVVMLVAGPGALVVGRGRPAGGAAHRVRVRCGRDGRHHVHAQLAGLRVHHARDPAHVPALDHVLPAERVPAAGADPGRVHAPVPGRDPAPRR